MSSFIGPFFAILFVVIFILMMQFLWLYIDELVGKGLSFKVILEFLGWGSATLIPLSLPLATLLSAVMTLGTLGENNELLAIKAAGISLKRVLMPLIIVSALISVGAFFISNELIPVAYNKIFTLRDDIGKTKEEIKIPTGTFYDGIDGYILRVGDRDKESGIMHGVMVYNHTGKKGNTSLTLADSAMMKMSEDKTYLTFVLFNGANYEETNTRKYRDTTLQLQKIEFDRQEMVIPLENYAFKKSDESRYGSEVMTKSLSQLRTDRDSLEVKVASTVYAQTARCVFSSNLEYTYQYDTTGKAKNATIPYPADSLFNWSSSHAEEAALREAINKLNSQITNFDFYERELYQSAYPLRRTIIESFRKFTLSLACLIFFFIGAPLGAIIRKGGLGTPVIISILFFVFYWVIDISGKRLANDGAISPFIGTFISSFILIPIGIFLTAKSSSDSGLFNADAYKIFFNKLSDRLKAFRKKTVKKNEA